MCEYLNHTAENYNNNNNNNNNKRELYIVPQNAEANSETQIIAHQQDA